MPASFFFVFRDAGAGNRGVGMPGGIWGFRDAGRNLGISGCRAVFGISGGGRVGAAMRASVWRGKEGARSEDCRVLGRLLGTRRIAGRSEGGRGACGSLCVFRARLVNAWAGSCRELPEGTDCWLRIAGGAGAGCREEGRLRVGVWDAWRRFVWQEPRWMQGRGRACGVLPVVRESGMKPGGGVSAFVGS